MRSSFHKSASGSFHVIVLVVIILVVSSLSSASPLASSANLGPQSLGNLPQSPNLAMIGSQSSSQCDSIVYQVSQNNIARSPTGKYKVLSSTNASKVIQYALAFGGTVCVRQGTYYLDHGLTIAYSGTSFLGLGGRPKLTFTDSLTRDNLLTIGLGNSEFINPSSVSGSIQNVTVSGITFDGRKTMTDTALVGGVGFETQNMGIFVLGGEYVTIIDVTVKNVGQYGVYFRATSPAFDPSSISPLPNLYDSVILTTVIDSRSGIFIDAVVAAPSDTMGVGNKIDNNTVVQNWSNMDIDVIGDSKGFGITDNGNSDTAISWNYVRGYTPNPSNPSHTNFAAFAFGGNSTVVVTSNSIDDCYKGMDFNPIGSVSGAYQVMINNLATRNVRYSVMFDAYTQNVTINNVSFVDPVDTVNNLAGLGVLVGAQVSTLHISKIDGSTNPGFKTIGKTALLQIASTASSTNVEVDGGAVNNLDLDFVINSHPTNLVIRNVSHYNPVGQISTPFDDDAEWMSPFGNTESPTSSRSYTVQGPDDFVSSAGGSSVLITIKDAAGNNVLTGASSLEQQYIPQGYTINFGNFTEQPTVTVIGS